MRVRFIGGEADGTMRSVEVVPGCLPDHIHVPAPTPENPGAVADYESMAGRFEVRGDGDPGAYLYVYAGPAVRPSGV